MRLPGTLGRRDQVMTFDPADYERVYRTEGVWPLRRGGFETLAYYRQKLRPDLFKKGHGLAIDQGEPWAAIRFKANPVMLPPKTVKTYIPSIDAITREFVEQLRAMRDSNNELPASFGHELNKWSLESIGCIALDRRLGVLGDGNAEMSLEITTNIKDFLRLSYQLEIQPSLWRYVATPKFNQLMAVYDSITR